MYKKTSRLLRVQFVFESGSEKTCLQDFRSGPTQTGCITTEVSKRLEIWGLGGRGNVLSSENKDAEVTAAYLHHS